MAQEGAIERLQLVVEAGPRVVRQDRFEAASIVVRERDARRWRARETNRGEEVKDRIFFTRVGETKATHLITVRNERIKSLWGVTP